MIGLVRLFARHRNAANLLMILAIVAGLAALTRLNTQFFPTIGLDVVRVSVSWPGASAEDVESAVLQVVEPEVRFLDGVKTVTGTAREGLGTVVVEFRAGTDMQAALSDVESAVARITTLPEEAEEPEISRVVPYEIVARLAVSGALPEIELKRIAKDIRDDLLARGIDRVTLFGARDEEIWIEVDEATLRRLELGLTDIAAIVGDTSQDLPLGRLEGGFEQQLRALDLRREAEGFADIEVRAFETGETIRLGDIARLSERFDRAEAVGRRDGLPAVEIVVERARTADALESADIVRDYLAEREGSWPAGVRVEAFDTLADLIEDRIDLLLRNGATGLVLVLAVLFLFLNARVAVWIAVGIPVSLMATAVVMLAGGQTINMVSLFGMIMALGIIVDDAIVVGEHAAYLRGKGLPPQKAAETGALRMLGPVVAASLTTIATFLPILLIGDVIGQIVSAIPLVVIAVLLASLVECFLILPAHMRDALKRNATRAGSFRQRFDRGFEAFRDGAFRRFVAACLRWRYAALATALAALILAVGLMAGGRVGFVFFPNPESETVYANFAFAPGTPRDRAAAMAEELREAAERAEERLTGGSGDILVMAFARVGAAQERRGAGAAGDHLGAVHVELLPSEDRDIRTVTFIEAWREEIRPVPGVERLIIRERTGGPPGRDIDIRLAGGDPPTLKRAALAVRDLLDRYEGVSDIEDDLPYGRPELILDLTPRGRALGFTTESVARQVRNAYEGAIADRFARGEEEVTVRVLLAAEGRGFAGLYDLPLQAPGGALVPLGDVVALGEDFGFSEIRREDGVREVAVTAEVDEAVANANAILEALEAGPLAAVAAEYGVDTRFAGRAEEQAETFADMRLGGMLGLAAMYVILAWVFASYWRPVVVMAIIPFGLIGAVLGHWLLGYDLTILSMVALLGLSGILVNDSIILVSAIEKHRADGPLGHEAIVDGTCERLRAVLLTTLTTIGGLTPLLFETSLQAQFLIPMAITLVFGLMVTSLLVLIVVPCLLAVQEDAGRVRSLIRSVRDPQGSTRHLQEP
ncbi:MAG: AcrB/AcrD/AcrF family protein [Gammaproteobacteria bacterium]|jgi:multidrug efflux pump subunit AcrB|nr:AcrB/AcrD/AcrF family protein [Gammaproteobacteria bacterium]